MDKKDVSSILEEIGSILEIKGENPFKCRAYHNASRVVDGLQEDLTVLVDSGRLGEIQGIGSALTEKITELVRTGHLAYYEELKASLPPGLLQMMNIQGVGPKKVKALYEKLGIKSIVSLEKACKENRLVDVEGFGAKTQENILKGIAYLKKNQGKFRVDEAMAEAGRLLEEIRKLKGVLRAEVGGSLRRHKEIIGDIDILVGSSQPLPIMEAFVQLPGVERVLAKGETKSSVLLASGIQADLRVVTDEQFAFALQYFTGNKEHNIAMRGRAQQRGMKLNEYGLFHIKGKKEIPVRCKNEAEIFKKLGLDFIEPELREDQGEIEAAQIHELPELVSLKQIRGIFHVHSVYSDGKATIEEMIRKASQLGLQYIGMSDHSQYAHYANGLTPDRLKKQQAEIDAVAKRYPKLKIFKGSEVDILPDGNLDYDEKTLSSFDFVVASVHSVFNLSEKEQTARIIKAIKNKFTTILGHPTGRLILAREPYAVNLKEVIDAAADYGKVIELNASPHRLDLDWRMCRYAKQKRVPISINPDAHSMEGLEDTQYGVGIARKGWLGPADIFNTLSASAVTKRLAKSGT